MEIKHTHQWIQEEIKSEIRKYLEINENKNNIIKLIGCSESTVKGKINSYKRLY